MPRRTKTAAQRLAAFQNYSDDIPINPLIPMREELELSQPEMAAYLGVNKLVVSQSEEGCYSLIPASYRRHITNIVTTNRAYQAYRRAKREFFWDKADFPEHPEPSKPMPGLLQHFDMVPYAFATRSCVTTAEIWKMATTMRMVTENFAEFLKVVGIDQDWIDEFNAALSRNSKPKVVLSAALNDY